VFNEILRIKPVLDSGTANQMEASLTSRFARIAGRFGQGLKAVVKGSVLGISLGLLNKLLNPLEALDEKIKKLLGEGSDFKDLADKFGTSGGKLKQFQDVAQSLGVSPDAFREALTKYNDAIEKAREEIANPFQEKSASTQIVGRFSNQKDQLEGFKSFLAFLKDAGTGPGIDQPTTARAARILSEASISGKPISDEQKQELISRGELVHKSGADTRKFFEKEILGSPQFGAFRRLIEADIPAASAKINEPNVNDLNSKIDKLSEADAQKRIIEAQNQNKDFVTSADKINNQVVQSLLNAEKRTEEETTKRLDSYEALRKGADAVEDVKVGINNILDNVTQGLKYLKSITDFIPKATGSDLIKGLFTFRNKKE
jgi:hypothetical protein